MVLFGEAVEGDVAAGEGAEEGVAGEGFVVFVGVGEGTDRKVAADTCVVQSSSHSTETSDYTAQTLPVGELSKSETEKLIPTREGPDPPIAVVALNTIVKLRGGARIEKL